jgi:hypothetical protein
MRINMSDQENTVPENMHPLEDYTVEDMLEHIGKRLDTQDQPWFFAWGDGEACGSEPGLNFLRTHKNRFTVLGMIRYTLMKEELLLNDEIKDRCDESNESGV